MAILVAICVLLLVGLSVIFISNFNLYRGGGERRSYLIGAGIGFGAGVCFVMLVASIVGLVNGGM